MSSGLSIFQKVSWLVFGRIIADGLSFLLYVAIAREFGRGGIGDYAYAFAVTSLFGIGIHFGLRTILTREIAKDESLAQKYWGNIILLQMLLVIVSTVMLYLLAIILNYQNEVLDLVILAYIVACLNAIGLSHVAYLDSSGRMDKTSQLEILSKGCIFLVGITLLQFGVEIKYIIFSHIFGSSIYIVVLFVWLKKFDQTLYFKFDLKLITKTAVAALPFLYFSFLSILYTRLDVVMIHYFWGEEETGSYAVSLRVVETALIVFSMIGIAIYPSLSKLTISDREKRDYIFYKSFEFITMVSFFGAIILVAAGDEMLIFVFSDEYIQAAVLLKVMSILFLTGSLKVPMWRLLLAEDQESYVLKILCISVAINIVLNLVLIPQYGANGAVVSTIISEFVLLVYLFSKCNALLDDNNGNRLVQLISIGVFSIVMCVILDNYMFWLFNVVIALLFYSFVLYQKGFITEYFMLMKNEVKQITKL